jgi:hypothetical protein
MAQNDNDKIVLFPKTQKQIEREQAQGEIEKLDVDNPIGTVYGVQQWRAGFIVGTSLYSSAAKQNFVLQTLKREQSERMRIWNEGWAAYKKDNSVAAPDALAPNQKEDWCEYKAINYPVY